MNQGVTMRRLALTDDILMKIEKPARYIGNEVNSVMKDKADVDIRLRCVSQMSAGVDVQIVLFSIYSVG